MKHLYWLFPFFYFAIAWFFPWDLIQWDSSISISYLFDILFVLIVTVSFKLFHFEFSLHLKGLIARSVAIIAAAIFSMFLINLFGLKAPFKYVENLALQILILAPIIEELIFRQAFYGVFSRYFEHPRHNLLLNSFLFSLSHLPAIWILPDEFKSFIIAQLFYTFLLGWLCAKSRMKSRTIFEPIVLHFIFNLLFYIAVKKQLL